jgi:MYXO-CTERM domain-containing protein
MKKARALFLTAALAAVGVLEVHDASACGGCFVSQTENTQVTGHKMILSVSQQQTTLYDQISYSGDPASFAWILPIKGLATIGLSSDALFQTIDGYTQAVINSPTISCNPGGCGFNGGGGGGLADGTSSGTGGGGVTVVAQQVVGPYETVQLQSTDPNALKDWLAQHNYDIPSDILPIIDAYVAEQFNFLALKLVPGQGINSMRPVRVTTDGASPTLPLRMVAAGTGMITPITLYVLGEGRYDTVNLPSFKITSDQLVWNWDTQSSNYTTLKQQGFTASQNKGWLVVDAEPFSKWSIENTLSYSVMYDPANSGYADDMGNGAQQAFMDDMTALWGSIPDNGLWVTRLEGQLSRAALGADLQIAAAADQSTVEHYFYVTKTVGTAPECPPPAPCDEPGYGGGGAAGWDFWGQDGNNGSKSDGCAMGGAGGAPIYGGLALMAALAFARRRARRYSR